MMDRPHVAIPESDRSTSIQNTEGEFIFQLLKRCHAKDTLEVGLAYGLSASYILSATTGNHIAIDPYQSEFADRGIRNVESMGYGSRFELRRQLSWKALTELIAEGRKFDFIFIDGDHKFDTILLDFTLADRLLKKGGHVLFHDMWMRSTESVVDFIRTNRKDYEPVPAKPWNLFLFKKTSEHDQRNWRHFREFHAHLPTRLARSAFRTARKIQARLGRGKQAMIEIRTGDDDC